MRGIEGRQVLMRIFLGERDRWQHRSLTDALVELLKKEASPARPSFTGLKASARIR